MKRLLWILLTCAAVAQTPTLAPTIIHGQSMDTEPSPTVWDQLTAGKLVVVHAEWAGTSSFISPGISDTAGNTWTAIPTTCHAIDGFGRRVGVNAWYAVANATTTDTITVSGLFGVTSFYSTGYGEFDNISGTLDGSGTCNTVTTATASITNLNTTTVNGDLLIGVGAGTATSNNMYAVYPNQLFGGNGASLGQAEYWRVAGLAGSQSTTFFDNLNWNAATAWVLLTFAFEPSTINITTNALFDGSQNHPYQATLQAVGGAGPLTWSNTAGTWPSGCSSSSISSAGVISCTPTSQGMSSLTFQATDGTHTTTRTISWLVGGPFLTPNVTATATGYSTTSGGVGVAQAVLPNACPGDVLVIKESAFTGGGTNSGAGVEPTNGSIDHWNIDCPATFTRLNPITGTPGNQSSFSSAGVITYIGNVTSVCSTTHLSYTLTAAAPTPWGFIFTVAQVRGVQPLVDDGVGTDQAGFASSPLSITTPNLTTQAANEYLFATGINGSGMQNSNIVSLSAPFTTGIPWFCPFALECQVIGEDQSSGTGTFNVTASETQSGGAWQFEQMAADLVGLRPALPPSVVCVPPVTELERRKKRVW